MQSDTSLHRCETISTLLNWCYSKRGDTVFARPVGRGNLKLGEDQIDIYAHPQLAELENPQLQ